MSERSERELIKHSEELRGDQRAIIDALIELRKKRDFDQQRVADLVGIDVQDVKDFEHYDADPSFVEIRQYAMAVNANIRTSVTDRESSAWSGQRDSSGQTLQDSKIFKVSWHNPVRSRRENTEVGRGHSWSIDPREELSNV